MSQLRVPRVHISIPAGQTTRHRFEPRYFIPLYEAEWAGSLPDPSIRVSEEDHPADCRTAEFFWVDIESVQAEYQRCADMFKRVFHLVYPSTADFSRAVEAEMNRGLEIEDAINRSLLDPAELEVELGEWLGGLEMKGLNSERKKQMAIRGLDSPGAVQKMELLKLAEVVGARVAKALKAATVDVKPSAPSVEDDASVARRIPRPAIEA